MPDATGDQPADSERSLRLSSTIGPIDAGIVPALIDAYRAATGVAVTLTGAGTAKTLELARGGGYDVVIVHAPALEAEFVADGWGLYRREVMANDFVIVGPAADPAGIRGLRDAVVAFGRIAATRTPFLTRGDYSGTHVKEEELWAEAGVWRDPAWYRVASAGARGNLATAEEAAAGGYTLLLDRATVAMHARRLGLTTLVQGDPRLLNVISAIPLNPDRLPGVRRDGAERFVAWLRSDDAQRLIRRFGAAEHGESLFFPRAPGWLERPPHLDPDS